MPEPRRLLLIDDDQDLRESMTDALQGSGFVVSSAANGQEALDLLASGDPPDVILLDLLMPVMNGWQFCEERKRDPRWAEIPIIAMSAAVSKDPWSPYYLDVDDFVAKPVELDDLLAKLAAVTDRNVEARRARR